jgi:hypothetical protein
LHHDRHNHGNSVEEDSGSLRGWHYVPGGRIDGVEECRS